MRVICIDDTAQFEDTFAVKKGHIYTVMEELKMPQEVKGNYRYRAGSWYILMEMPQNKAYLGEMFIKIEEDQQDETEFQRNYQKEKA